MNIEEWVKHLRFIAFTLLSVVFLSLFSAFSTDTEILNAERELTVVNHYLDKDSWYDILQRKVKEVTSSKYE
ncbi:MAG: hypothetical protein V3U65_10160, partial [Granulosicoccaceae bacterium]